MDYALDQISSVYLSCQRILSTHTLLTANWHGLDHPMLHAHETQPGDSIP